MRTDEGVNMLNDLRSINDLANGSSANSPLTTGSTDLQSGQLMIGTKPARKTISTYARRFATAIRFRPPRTTERHNGLYSFGYLSRLILAQVLYVSLHSILPSLIYMLCGGVSCLLRYECLRPLFESHNCCMASRVYFQAGFRRRTHPWASEQCVARRDKRNTERRREETDGLMKQG
ncbi:hypothetical protein BDN71DRAFT_459013 [Pleurotus eryngii]|uniref:Uncharacterized protein n=1 Tax=Pleurotus eryngii TaxID=5323 RepID=A0A9P5ZJ52_PLEER|nr:hypothetical protein BDN71DRAFT_459013 [Pleurotus eryngii]